MTCRKHAGGCGHEFCWLCKGDWKDHGSATGGYYQCNIYDKTKQEGKLPDEEKAAQEASNELERYEFHWTRYDSHSKSSRHAKEKKAAMHEKMHELAQTFKWRLNEAQFLMDAVEESIVCWHVLAWTYPIAYYFEEEWAARQGSEENKNKKKDEKEEKDKGNSALDLFKQQQGFLESFCDGLQQKLDFDLEKLGDIKIRQEMKDYTRTAKQYRKNIVQHIEDEVSF
jgi:ariadne-1